MPSPADFLTTEVAGTPIILIRQEDGGMRAFLNACAHRHTKLTNRWRGHSRLLVCPVMPGPIVSSRGSQRSPDIPSFGCYQVKGPADFRSGGHARQIKPISLQNGEFYFGTFEEFSLGTDRKNLIVNFAEGPRLFRVHRGTFPLRTPRSA